MKIRIGSRGSNLALTQTNWVGDQLKAKYPDLEVEVVIIKTKGDKILDVALDKIGDKGLFVKELETALFEKKIDFAVHSMKDMPSDMTPGLAIAPTPLRVDRRDVLILKEGYKTLEDLPENSVIGTGSKRRCFQLLEARPDLRFEPIRGNIETRIKKLSSQNLDGIVLAAAGIHRLGLDSVITAYMEDDLCLPAPAQGALAIQYRSDDQVILDLLTSIADLEAQKEIVAERSFLKHTKGGCHVPVGAVAHRQGDDLILKGLFGKEDGSRLVKASIRGPLEQGEALGKQLADQILKEVNHG